MGDIRRLNKKGCRNYGCDGTGNTGSLRKIHRSKKYCPNKLAVKLSGTQKKKTISKKFDGLDKELIILENNINSSFATQMEEV